MAEHRLVISERRQTLHGVGFALIFAALAAWVAIHL